jgi:hypothetical protein
MDASKSPDERVMLLLPVMSLKEKVNQMLHGEELLHCLSAMTAFASL